MIVDGVELLIMAKNNKIKNRTKIKNVNYDKYYEYRDRTFWAETYNIGEEMAFSEILENQFIILSEGRKEDEGIDIQAIEEFEIGGCNVKMGDAWVSTENLVNDMLLDKTNKLIKAVKQLDKNKVDK